MTFGMTTNRARAWLGFALAAGPWGVLAAPGAAAEAGAGEWGRAKIAGRLPARIKEASGLAASRREAGLFWTHGDSGGEPVLRAIQADGTLRGTVRIVGAKNIDWEDIASFDWDGRAWLLVADTGDNQAARADCALYVIAEPDPAALRPGAEVSARVAWRIPVIYPDGPRDCEAVAVDAKEGKVYLLAKRVTPHGLYALPLRPAKAGEVAPAAERVGETRAFPAAQGAQRWLPVAGGAFRAQPTGMDFAADGSAAVVVTYGDVLVYPRIGDETWAAALARPPRRLAPHGLEQAEAVAFGAGVNGGGAAAEIHVTSEGAGAPILRYVR